MDQYTPDLAGFYDKYQITRSSDGSKVEGPSFLLRPADPHARKAIAMYALSVRVENPQLADDLISMLATSLGLNPYDVLDHVLGNSEDMKMSAFMSGQESITSKPLQVCDCEGNPILTAVWEYDPGDSSVGIDAYAFWRQETCSEREDRLSTGASKS